MRQSRPSMEAFGPDAMLYIPLGERSDAPMRLQAQKLDSQMGKSYVQGPTNIRQARIEVASDETRAGDCGLPAPTANVELTR